jgi:hypothetical protein
MKHGDSQRPRKMQHWPRSPNILKRGTIACVGEYYENNEFACEDDVWVDCNWL